MRILLVGGGSIGHIAPAVAVWRAIERSSPGSQVHMICSKRTEDQDFLRSENIPFTPMAIPRRSVMLPIQFLQTYRHASEIIGSFQPDVVFSKGGALSVPVCFAAQRRGIPVVLHESDAKPGHASRMIARIATKVCTGFPDVMIGETSTRTHTGNPVRPDILKGSREEGLRITGFSGHKPVLLVTGGSQGAETFNRAIQEILSELLTFCDVIHLTGRGKMRSFVETSRWDVSSRPGREEETRAPRVSTNAQKIPGYFPLEFAHEQLPHLYALASLALSRSGAGNIAELSANGIPAILVPLEGVAQNHQWWNAKATEAFGGAILLPQSRLSQELLPTVRSLLENTQKLREMSEAADRGSQPDAARKIAMVVTT